MFLRYIWFHQTNVECMQFFQWNHVPNEVAFPWPSYVCNYQIFQIFVQFNQMIERIKRFYAFLSGSISCRWLWSRYLIDQMWQQVTSCILPFLWLLTRTITRSEPKVTSAKLCIKVFYITLLTNIKRQSLSSVYQLFFITWCLRTLQLQSLSGLWQLFTWEMKASLASFIRPSLVVVQFKGSKDTLIMGFNFFTAISLLNPRQVLCLLLSESLNFCLTFANNSEAEIRSW